jgi:hypothetical protein
LGWGREGGAGVRLQAKLSTPTKCFTHLPRLAAGNLPNPEPPSGRRWHDFSSGKLNELSEDMLVEERPMRRPMHSSYTPQYDVAGRAHLDASHTAGAPQGKAE